MRRQFVVIAVLLVLFLLSFHYLSFLPVLSSFSREQFWQIFTVICVGFSLWALWGQFHGLTILPLLVLPTLYPLGMTFFSSLLPDHWIVPFLFSIIFGVTFYFLLLVENIYAVSSVRAIPLLRAARPIGFLFTIVTALLLFMTLFSFRQHVGLNALFGGLLIFPLSVQTLWTVKLDHLIGERVILFSTLTSFFIAQVVVWTSFLPVWPTVQALLVVIILYVLLGIFQLEIAQRLRQGILTEYLIFAGGGLIGFLLLITVVLR